MENFRKRVDIKLVTDEKKLMKLTSKPTFVTSKIFNERLVAVHKIKEILMLNSPAYVGMCILDLSKTLMYDFHYNYIKKKYNDKTKLLFTDLLTYEIETKDVYKDFWSVIIIFYYISFVIDFLSEKYICSAVHNSMRMRRVRLELAASWFENQVPSL